MDFTRRVLHLAKDDHAPLLERLRFLCISSANTDEFFEIRVAELVQMDEFGSVQAGPGNMTRGQTLNAISEGAHEIMGEQHRVLNEELIPALAREDIRFIRRGSGTSAQEAWPGRYFEQPLAPVLSPLGLVRQTPQVGNRHKKPGTGPGLGREGRLAGR